MELIRNHTKKRAPATRTVQGLFGKNGGYAQAITMARLMDDGCKLELWLGIGKDDIDVWAPISYIHFDETVDGTIYSVLLGTEDGCWYYQHYTDAIKSRVKRNL